MIQNVNNRKVIQNLFKFNIAMNQVLFFLKHLHTLYSSKIFEETLLRALALLFTLALFCIGFVWRFNSVQLLVIPLQLLIFLFWEWKDWWIPQKQRGGINWNSFIVIYNFSKWAHLCYHMRTCNSTWLKVAQNGTWSTWNCIF